MAKIRTFSCREYRFEASQVTWAGEYPWGNGFCFGTEDGEIAFSGEDGGVAPFEPSVKSRDAINGVAFSPGLIGISTPGVIQIHRFQDPPGLKMDVGLIEGGAHGVVATGRGGLIFPRGTEGLLVEPSPTGEEHRYTIRPQTSDVYFYKVVSLGLNDAGEEIIACAGREGGMLGLSLAPGDGPGPIAGCGGRGETRGDSWDIVDICSLNSTSFPHAIVGLGVDNSLHLSRDIMRDRTTTTMGFPQFRGTAYSIFCARGHIFLLTSRLLYVLPGLADRFLRGENLHVLTNTRGLIMDAIDGTLAYGETLLIVREGSVACIGVEQFAEDGDRSPLQTPNDLELPSEDVEYTPRIEVDSWDSTSVGSFNQVCV